MHANVLLMHRHHSCSHHNLGTLDYGLPCHHRHPCHDTRRYATTRHPTCRGSDVCLCRAVCFYGAIFV